MANTNSDGRLVALNELKLKLAGIHIHIKHVVNVANNLFITTGFFTSVLEHQKLAKAKNIFDDAWLTGFLNGTKYDVDGAIKCVRPVW